MRVTEGTFVCARVRTKKRGVHESRDFHGILKSFVAGNLKSTLQTNFIVLPRHQYGYNLKENANEAFKMRNTVVFYMYVC